MSSTTKIPEARNVPTHVAIIMDGNGRWASRKMLPRVVGHRSGIKSVRRAVEFCHTKKINYLTLFAFSSENWRRPVSEVSFLMDLFEKALEDEVAKLIDNNVRLKIIGDRAPFSPKLRGLLEKSESLTEGGSDLTLTVAVNYGGRWDILNAIKQTTILPNEDLTEEKLTKNLALHYAPEPDLFIRTGGEQRISNFLIWDLAYTELYFTDALWPDFDDIQFDQALRFYAGRERRFGRTSEQTSGSESGEV